MDSIEKTLGSLKSTNTSNSAVPPPTKAETKSGIDVVLGGQWGDEGKGKLVDILSQVCVCVCVCICVYVCILLYFVFFFAVECEWKGLELQVLPF